MCAAGVYEAEADPGRAGVRVAVRQGRAEDDPKGVSYEELQWVRVHRGCRDGGVELVVILVDPL